MPAKAFTFVCGADEFLVAREAQSRWDTLTRGVTDDFAREVIDGAAGVVGEVESTVASFIAAVQTLPMFGESKCVWLKNASFFGDTAVGRTEGAKAQVEKLIVVLEALDPAQATVLISAFPVDRRKREFKKLQSIADVVFLEDRAAGEGALHLLEEELKRDGVRIQPDAAYALLEKIHNNSRLAVEEARKLSTYLGAEGGEITQQMVNMLVPAFGEGDFFEAAESFFNLDLQETLASIRRHFFAGYDIRPLLTSLQNRTRLLIQLRVLMDAGEFRRGVNKRAMEDCAAIYGRHFGDEGGKSNFNVFTQNPYYLSRLTQAAQRLRLRQLIDFQSSFLRAFEEAISRPSEHEQIMRETAIRCLG